MKNYFNTKEEAERYRVKHELWVRVAEYIVCRNKWALVFPIKACITVE
jgi:hypothetical protein